ncbi:hypothetical protein [Winogradskya humida]|uniref:Peptidylprolyl isomerase n=1 Tax=Winogradskya humida TaxID=113566 RepID=A0ABQ3ZPI4_9ACTN|nr:hypothetical protein [Actinoplanes humidus]GIE20408.1 hypothetical protein Ahu01nite_035100 [Actinoplanes humidus]
MKKILAGLALVITALVVTGAVLAHRSDVVGSIDGHDVTRDELVFHRDNDRTLADVWTDKTIFVLAQEQGLTDSVDYDDFLDEVERENKRRADAIAKGETVYGVTDFSPEEYYTHRLAELRTGLEKKLGDGPLLITDAEVRQKFEASKADWSANATTYAYTKLVVPGSATTAISGRLADVRIPGSKLSKETYGGAAATTGLSTHDQDLMAVLTKLAPGQISSPVPGTGQTTYYELDGTTVDESAAFATYSQRIRAALVEEKFDRYIQNRVQNSHIEVDINPEDVQ